MPRPVGNTYLVLAVARCGLYLIKLLFNFVLHVSSTREQVADAVGAKGGEMVEIEMSPLL